MESILILQEFDVCHQTHLINRDQPSSQVFNKFGKILRGATTSISALFENCKECEKAQDIRTEFKSIENQMAENVKRLVTNQEGCLQGILGRAVLARHKVISAIVLGIILGTKYQVQVMNIFENNKPNILFRQHFNGMY